MSNTVPASTFKPSGGFIAPVKVQPADAWKSMTLGDLANTPINELLRTLGVCIVEVDPGELAEDGIVGYFFGRVGNAEIQIERTMPQADREQVVRELLGRISLVEQSYTKKAPTPARLRPAQVSGGCVHIECFDWCTIDHVEDNAVNLEDVSHSGNPVALEVPSIGRRPVALLHARLNADPFGSSEPHRAPGVQVDDEASTCYLTPAQSLEFADNLVAFAAAIRDQAAQAGR